jgi:hypothetical protein
MRSKNKGDVPEPYTRKYSVEPEDYLKILAKLSEPKWRFFRRLRTNKKVVTYDNSNNSLIYDFKNKKCKLLVDDVLYNFSTKKCSIIASDIQISEGDVIKGFLELFSNKMKNIENLEKYLERKTGSKLEEISKVKNHSSLTSEVSGALPSNSL